MNKFELMNVVSTSTLKADDKNLLFELLLRMDDNGECWPSVARLCQVRGIKYEKNFKGIEYYLPGLVDTHKRGRSNYYVVSESAIKKLEQAPVVLKNTPSREGVSAQPVSMDTPAVEGVYTPAVAEDTPAVEGTDSTYNTSIDSSLEELGATAPVDHSSNLESSNTGKAGIEIDQSSLTTNPTESSNSSTPIHTPATEGVLEEVEARQEENKRLYKERMELARLKRMQEHEEALKKYGMEVAR